MTVSIVVQEVPTFALPPVSSVRETFNKSPADAPPPGIVAIPVQMRFVHAVVPATVRPPAKVEV